ncbi:MAG: hypothetical protein ACOCUT_04150 [bacterium]
MMKNKKAQSALEFLTTYGWAFLVILIMIGALGYFGILNPTRYLPERCNVNSEFACDEFSVVDQSDDMNISVVLRNSLGQAINVSTAGDDIVLVSDYFNGQVNASSSDTTCVIEGESEGSSVVIEANQEFLFNCRINSPDLAVSLPGSGNKVAVEFNLQYLPQGKSLRKSIAGEVFATVQ